MTIDPAMLIYLDGDPSEAIDPNENYSRELQELFTIGVDNVTEPNVKAGAKALAGWDVDWNTATAVFHQYAAISTPVTFLGRSCLRYDDVVNAAVDHPACAPFVAAKLHKYFHGVDPTPARKAELGDLFRTNNMEILPLVTAILRDPNFFDPTLRMNRPRYPVEWVSAAFAAITSDGRRAGSRTSCDNMGQLPFSPPNVAGWPASSKWLAANVAVLRAQVGNAAPALTAIRNAADPVQAALAAVLDLRDERAHPRRADHGRGRDHDAEPAGRDAARPRGVVTGDGTAHEPAQRLGLAPPFPQGRPGRGGCGCGGGVPSGGAAARAARSPRPPHRPRPSRPRRSTSAPSSSSRWRAATTATRASSRTRTAPTTRTGPRSRCRPTRCCRSRTTSGGTRTWPASRTGRWRSSRASAA